MFKKLGTLLMILPLAMFAQHSIKGNFSPPKDFDNVILYKITPTASEYIAHTAFDEQGNFEIKLDSTATQGMYRLVYALPQDEFNFDVIYNGKEDVELAFTAGVGIKYQSSIENTLINSYTNSMGLVTQEIGDFYKSKSEDSLTLASIFKTQKETQASYEEAAKETLALHFIEANTPYIPEHYENVTTYVQNIRTHFFDHVNFNDEVLQSSDFLIERILNFVFGMSSGEKDQETSYRENIDAVYLAMKEARLVIKGNLLEVLWQQMVDANYESLANYIAEKYLLDIAKSLKDEELVNGLTLFKSLSIGNKAPDFSFEITEEGRTITKKLSDLKSADKYILVFWSSTCGHCLKEIPQLQSYLRTFEVGDFKVIAFGLEDEPKNWNKEIQKYPEFIHVYGKDKWANTTAKNYNIRSTPTYYILDKDKEIIAKPYDIEALRKLYDK
ncbi:TlpA family protein disulfide reductase [Flavobacteriaceae bacterium AU392]|nr:TlpA family protein disulfide reductase [Flavobacteriaceae bacterium]RKM84059.1 TlpA family protein disulfide reductase [Flavobacteriaceae bacterium AU392]